MKIAVLSGKGGAGKTTFTVNWAASLGAAQVLDCDVEEPNCHLFLPVEPESLSVEVVTRDYPVINENLCTNCGKCARFCRYHALLATPAGIVTMTDVCHSCGGCQIVCPAGAVAMAQKEVGTIETGHHQGLSLSYGKLRVGEYSGVRIISRMIEKAHAPLVLIDAPPGTSCSTVAAVERADFAVVVTEPTPFGLRDMQMVVEMLRSLKVPFGVVINRWIPGKEEVDAYCRSEEIPLLGRIPFSKKWAHTGSRGGVLYKEESDFREIMDSLGSEILRTAKEAAYVKEG